MAIGNADGQIRIRLTLDGNEYDAEIDAATGKTRNFGQQTKKTAADLSHMRGVVLAAASAMGALAAVRIVGVVREFERLNAQLITAEQSEAGARRAFEQIKDFASTTPFLLAEVTDAYIKLKNLGLTPSERALESYGNTAASMGKDLNQLIEAVADASVGEFERLKEFGIRTEVEGDKVRFTFRGVTTEVRKSAGDIEAFLIQLGETEFAGGMARQMDTLDGALSNLDDTLATTANAFAGSSGFTQLFASGVRDLTTTIGEAEDEIQIAGELMTVTVAVVADGITGLVESGKLGFSTLGRIAKAAGVAQAAARRGGDGIKVFREEMAKLANDSEDGIDRVLDSFGKFQRRLDEIRAARGKDGGITDPPDRSLNGTGGATPDEIDKQNAAIAALNREFREIEIQALDDRFAQMEQKELDRAEARRRLIEEEIRDHQLKNDLLLDNERATAQALQTIDEERAAARTEIASREAEQRIREERRQQQLVVALTRQVEEQKLGVLENAIGLARQAAGENTELQIALFAAEKAIAIGRSIVATQVAAARALAEGGPIAGPPLAATIQTLGAANTAIIAATTVVEGLSFAGGKASGGDVHPGQFAQVGERDQPELVRVGNRSYLIPGDRGATVQPAQRAQGGSASGNLTINLIEDSARAGQVEQRQNGNDVEADVFVSDILGRGSRAQALEQAYPSLRRGSR